MTKEIKPANLKLDSNAKKQIHKRLNLVKEIFGQDLLGIYLYGSSILGGLQKYSDIDLFVVSNRATTREEKAKLATALLKISGIYMKSKKFMNMFESVRIRQKYLTESTLPLLVDLRLQL